MRSLISLLPVAGSLLATSRAAPTHVKRSTWLPAQGGCWSDNTDGVRALDRGLGGFDDLTPDKCQSLCEAQGFSLAGVEYGRECCRLTIPPDMTPSLTKCHIDCGNTVFGNNRPASADTCSMACAGDSTQTCGGANAISIYVKDDYQFTVGPASVVESYNGYDKTQCWQYVLIHHHLRHIMLTLYLLQRSQPNSHLGSLFFHPR
jgi:hypothetical protein